MADMSKINFNIDGVNNEFDIKDKKAREDNALMHSTWGGVLNKNLFNINGDINRMYDGSIPPDEQNTVDGDTIIFNRNSQIQHLSGQFISNLKNRRLAISFTCESLGTGTTGTFRMYKRNTGTSTLLLKEIRECGDYKYEYISTEDEILFAFGMASTDGGKGLRIKNLMVRYADIIDDTYEPYKPSIDTRLTTLENSVNHISPKWGRAYAESTKGWYRVGECIVTPSSGGTTRIATFVVNRGNGGWGLLKTHVVVNNGAIQQNNIEFIGDSDIAIENIVITGKNNGNIYTFELWCHCVAMYDYYRFLMLDNGSSTIPNNSYDGYWKLFNTVTPHDNYTQDADSESTNSPIITTNDITKLTNRIAALEATVKTLTTTTTE